MTEQIYNDRKRFVELLLRKISNMALKTYFIKIEKNNYFNDTCYKANQLIDNFLNAHLGFDTHVNFIDNLKTTKLFHGGQGLLTYNCLKKPLYNAYYLLSKLKGHVISKGSFHCAVKNEQHIIILLYNNLEPIDDSLQNIEYYEQSKRLANKKHMLTFL